MAKRQTKRERRRHLVIDSRTGEMVCQHCGDRHSFPGMATFKAVLTEIEGFCRRNENCKPAANEQEQ
jgi:hypothetical protein